MRAPDLCSEPPAVVGRLITLRRTSTSRVLSFPGGLVAVRWRVHSRKGQQSLHSLTLKGRVELYTAFEFSKAEDPQLFPIALEL